MTFVTLSDEQAQLINGATSPIVLVDPKGREVGKVAVKYSDALTSDDSEEEIIAEIKRRMATHDGSFRLYSDLLKELRDRFPE